MTVTGGASPCACSLCRGGSERAREARRELLQRTLLITLDGIFDASHDGVLVELGGDLSAWCAFPQLVLYLGLARDMTTEAVEWLHAVYAGGPAVCDIVP